MSWLITIIVGFLIGWMAGLASGSFRRYGTTANIASGVAGSIIGFWLYSSVFAYGLNITTVNLFSTSALLWEAIGAVVWIGLMNLIQVQEVRSEERLMEERGWAPKYGYEYYQEDEEMMPARKKPAKTGSIKRTTRRKTKK